MQKLTRQEMKEVLGGMQWTGCGSNNIIDCRRNAIGAFNLYVPGKPFDITCPNDGPTYEERLATCMGWDVPQ